jgi:hypothetical protein
MLDPFHLTRQSTPQTTKIHVRCCACSLSLPVTRAQTGDGTASGASALSSLLAIAQRKAGASDDGAAVAHAALLLVRNLALHRPMPAAATCDELQQVVCAALERTTAAATITAAAASAERNTAHGGGQSGHSGSGAASAEAAGGGHTPLAGAAAAACVVAVLCARGSVAAAHGSAGGSNAGGAHSAGGKCRGDWACGGAVHQALTAAEVAVQRLLEAARRRYVMGGCSAWAWWRGTCGQR